MKAVDERPPDSKRDGGRLARFSEACLRITSGQALDSVLQEVIDSACSLTEARYGGLITLGDSGAIEDFKTSGITHEERRRLGDLPKRLGILGYLTEIEEPLRLADISGYAGSVGIPKDHPAMKTFLGCPVRYQGERLGSIYLTEKDGGQEFSQEDEDILVMFATQAALVITSTRRHAEERRARADLEALVNISPVGVLVFDPKTGGLISFNEETRRIVGKLNAPGRDLDQLLETMTLRTPDGREIPIDELPTTRAVRSGETVLADEVVIHLLDGRTINTLVNARPIHREDGEIVSVVATLQDITPLETVKRQRREFLDMVGHELRTPLSAIKGSTASLLGSAYLPDAVETRQFLRVIDEQADHMRQLINNLVDMTQIEAGALQVALEPTVLKDVLEEAREALLQDGTSHHIELDLAPDLPRIMADGRRIFQTLRSLIKTVSDHSHEPSTIVVSASLRQHHVGISVESVNSVSRDDRSPYPVTGLSRAGEDTGTTNGREGLTLAICRGVVEAHGGRLAVRTGAPGHGARFDFTMPAVNETADSAGNDSDPNDSNPLSTHRGRARVLAVDGDPELRRHIRNTLLESGFTPVVSGNPDEIERLLEAEKPHAVIVDPALSWSGGAGLMERIRRTSDAPVIFVSGRGGGQEVGLAFEHGAFDHIAKPFTSSELVARTRAALRRGTDTVAQESPGRYLKGDLTIDYGEREVTVAGRRVPLTATEYRLLFELSTAAGWVLTYEQLLRRVWGPLYASDSRVVHTFVGQLRAKLGDNARRPKYIFTEPRVGYHMARPEEPANNPIEE